MDNPESVSADDAADRGSAAAYSGVCLATLVVLVVGLDRLRPGASSLVPAIPLLIGAVALFFRFTSGPPFVLVILSGVIMYTLRGDTRVLPGGPPGFVAEYFAHRLIICAAALIFVIAFYRRLAIESSIFPPDRRKVPLPRTAATLAPLPPVQRGSQLVTSTELVSSLVVVGLSCISGFVLWMALNQIKPPRSLLLDENRVQWRLLVVCWVLVAAGAIGWVVLGYIDRARATPAQNLLFLQDQLWRETRTEQNRIHRWLVWTRFRGQRRKEKS
jgi:hypothetical protein